MLLAILGIMLGGALGALSRYLATLGLQMLIAGSGFAGFPLGTLVVNVLGSFLLAFVTTLGLQGLVSPTLRLAFGTGFVGALTTFSTFEVESNFLLQEGQAWSAALYVLGNLLLGYLAVLLGNYLAVTIGGRA